MPHQRPAVAAQCDDALDQLAIDLPDSGEHGEEDQHGHENEGQCDLRSEPDAEPDHEQWREDHARDGVQHAHDRLQQLGDERNQRGDDAERNADHDAERKAAERGREGRVEMRPDATIGEQVDEHRSNPARARRIHRIEHVGAVGRFPYREQDRKGGKLPNPGIARIVEHQAASAR